MAADTDSIPDRTAASRWSWFARADVIATALAIVPVVIAALRAAAGRWVPIGDDAYFTVRSLDVGTEHHPLLGAWSSGSIGIDRQINNLGPLQLDLLAPFTRIAPYGGTAIAVAVVNVAAIVTTAWLLGRLGGRLATVVGMVPISLLLWTMGSEMLITPRQHQFLLLTYLCFLVAAWAAAAGDRWAIVPAVVTASLLTQTHLSYPILVAGVGVVAIAGQIIAWRGLDRRDRHRYRRPWAIAALLAVVLWAQTLIDQFAGRGNLVDVLVSPGSGEQPGLVRALRIVGATLLDPRSHVRNGYATFEPDPIDDTVAAIAVVIVVAVLAAAAVVGWRSHHVRATAGLAVGAAAVVAAIVDTSQLPVTFFGLVSSNYRWLWPTATFLLIGAGVALTRTRFVRERLEPGVVPVLSVVAIATLPTSLQVQNPARYANDQHAVANLIDQIEDLDVEGPVVIDQTNMYFSHPFGYSTALALTRQGYDYRFVEEVQDRRFGADRVADGTEPTTLVLWAADDALARADDPDTVAYVEADPPLAVVVER